MSFAGRHGKNKACVSATLALNNGIVIYWGMPRPQASADPFHAVADPTRRAILDLLRSGETPFADLAAAFDMTGPAVSRHLRILREARLIHERRSGEDARMRSYRLDPLPLREVVEWARGYQTYWDDNLTALKRHVEGRKRRS